MQPTLFGRDLVLVAETAGECHADLPSCVHHHPVVVPTEVHGTCFDAYHVTSIAQNCTDSMRSCPYNHSFSAFYFLVLQCIDQSKNHVSDRNAPGLELVSLGQCESHCVCVCVCVCECVCVYVCV